ncbi:FAD-dependent monooxygenase [Kineococcus esterisolvens]|uniref:FAD-dependent monooxygenase n=1 Tax=unclassified Kineococcus TaxID=2621656 RepID=UPI003D7D0F1B
MISTSLADLPERTDVLIAGGGPSGLFLALDLARRGVRSVVLEPRVEIDWTRPRAKTTNARTMTHLRRLGLAGELRAAAPLPVSYSDSVLFCTSLAGRELTRFTGAFQLQDGRYEPQPECGQQVPQPVVEQVLRTAVAREERTALHLGARFTRSSAAAGARDGTLVTVEGGSGNRAHVRARYLVGADGVSSAVRADLGVRLEGSSAAKSNLGVVFRSRGTAGAVALDPAVQYWVTGAEYAGMIGRLDLGDLWWAIVQGYDPDAPKFADVPVEDVLRALVGADVDVEVVAQDPWTARMLLAPTYRRGATFLLGDAAHANPPWGGHGFNTCVGDAANLAWKLAAVLDGWAGEELLDSYEAERRPVARRTVDEAARNGTLLADDLLDPHLEEDGEAGERARARAARALAVKESEFHALGLVLGYSYTGSPLCSPDPEPAPAPDPVAYHPSAVPGCLLPHAWLDERTSLYDVLGPGFTLLLDADAFPAAPAPGAVPTGAPLEVRTVRHPAAGSTFTRVWGAPAVLVRPDQHVAWRGCDLGEVPAALARATGTVPAPGGRRLTTVA